MEPHRPILEGSIAGVDFTIFKFTLINCAARGFKSLFHKKPSVLSVLNDMVKTGFPKALRVTGYVVIMLLRGFVC